MVISRNVYFDKKVCQLQQTVLYVKGQDYT